MTGYVYAIESGDAVKIGFGKNPIRRLSELNVGAPGTHRLIGFARGERLHEEAIHHLCGPHRIRGEWFRKEGTVLIFLNFLPKYIAPIRPLASGRLTKGEVAEKLNSKGLKLCFVAERMSVDKSTVTRWLQSKIPAERVLELERFTGIPRHELRPDIYPPADAGVVS